MFTHENTIGFSDSELALCNEALAFLVERGMDEQNASARITDNWSETRVNTVESLTRA